MFSPLRAENVAYFMKYSFNGKHYEYCHENIYITALVRLASDKTCIGMTW